MAMILVVDDQEEVCESIKSILQSSENAVHTAQTVGDGAASLRRCMGGDWPFADRYGVAVIDLHFKNFEGTEQEKAEAGMRVVESALQVPFLEPIVLTAFPSQKTTAEALACGVFRYITKLQAGENKQQFTERLGEAVRLALDNREVMRTLHESLKMVRASIESMVLQGAKGPAVDDAQVYLDWAEKAYRIILRARGRNPSSQ